MNSEKKKKTMNTHVLLSVNYRAGSFLNKRFLILETLTLHRQAAFFRNKRLMVLGDFNAPQTGSVESLLG